MTGPNDLKNEVQDALYTTAEYDILKGMVFYVFGLMHINSDQSLLIRRIGDDLKNQYKNAAGDNPMLRVKLDKVFEDVTFNMIKGIEAVKNGLAPLKTGTTDETDEN